MLLISEIKTNKQEFFYHRVKNVIRLQKTHTKCWANPWTNILNNGILKSLKRMRNKIQWFYIL